MEKGNSSLLQTRGSEAALGASPPARSPARGKTRQMGLFQIYPTWGDTTPGLVPTRSHRHACHQPRCPIKHNTLVQCQCRGSGWCLPWGRFSSADTAKKQVPKCRNPPKEPH